MPNVLSPRDLVFRPDNMDETVPHTGNNLIEKKSFNIRRLKKNERSLQDKYPIDNPLLYSKTWVCIIYIYLHYFLIIDRGYSLEPPQ